MQNGWVEVDKKNPDGPKVLRKVNIFLKKIQIYFCVIYYYLQIENIEDEVQILLKKIKALQLNDVLDKTIQDLKKRKLIAEM